MRLKMTLFVTLFLLNATTQGHTQEIVPNQWYVSLSGAALYKPKFLGSDSYETMVLPYITALYQFEDQRTSLMVSPLATGLAYEAFPNFTVGLKMGLRDERRSKDDVRLTGLKSISYTVDAGPFIRYKMGKTTLIADLQYDLLNEYKGYTSTVEVNFQDKAFYDSITFGLGAGATYGNGSFMKSYFGVSKADENLALGRPAYDADAGIGLAFVKAHAFYHFNPRWFTRVGTEVIRLVGDAKDSPLVRDKTQTYTSLSLGYRF